MRPSVCLCQSASPPHTFGFFFVASFARIAHESQHHKHIMHVQCKLFLRSSGRYSVSISTSRPPLQCQVMLPLRGLISRTSVAYRCWLTPEKLSTAEHELHTTPTRRDQGFLMMRDSPWPLTLFALWLINPDCTDQDSFSPRYWPESALVSHAWSSIC